LIIFLAKQFFASKNNIDTKERFIITGIFTGIIACLIDNLGSMNLRVLPVMLTWWLMVILLNEMLQTKMNVVPEYKIVRFSTPTILRKFPYVPLLAFSMFLFYYFPIELHHFRSDKSLLTGYKYSEEGNISLANSYFAEGQKEYSSNPFLLFNTAGTFAQLGKTDTALTLISSLLQYYPAYPKAHLVKGIIFYQQHKIPEAIEEMKTEISYRNHQQSYFYLASLYKENKDTNNEIQTLQTLLEKSVKSGNPESVIRSLQRLSELHTKIIDKPVPVSELRNTFTSNKAIISALDSLIILKKN